MRKVGLVLGIGACLILATANSALAARVTLTFDELPPQPADGLSFMGVTFGFTVGGEPSMDATYGGSGPGEMCFVQDPSLEGDAAGILQLDFAVPTPVLEFGLARSSFEPMSPGFTVALFDAGGGSIGTFDSDTDVCMLFSEAQFTYGNPASPVSRAVITFPGNMVAPRFALDNLTYDDGAPASSRARESRAPVGASWAASK